MIDKYNYFLEKLNNIMKNAVILERLIYKHYYQNVFGSITEPKLNPIIKIDENTSKIMFGQINTIMEKINN